MCNITQVFIPTYVKDTCGIVKKKSKKGQRRHQGAVDKLTLVQQICDGTKIIFAVTINWS